MPAPRRVDDGNYTVAKIVGEPKTEWPFASEGNLAWVVTYTMRQDEAYFRPLTPMSRIQTRFGIGYLVGPENTRGIGQGLLEWQRRIAVVPATRVIPCGLVTLNIQVLYPPITSTTYELEEFALVQPGTATWEYSTRPFTVNYAVRTFLYDRDTRYVTIGGDPNADPNGAMAIAENSELGLYEGLIYYRKTIRCPIAIKFNSNS